MSTYSLPPSVPDSLYATESLRLEAVTTCVGFDDMLDVSLAANHRHLDTMIVVTSHEDRLTQSCCQKHGVTCVQTDLFKKNGRKFNKGAAINAGMDHFQWHGWRMHLDADIVLPEEFRRVIFNHTHLERDCIYGANRMDVMGRAALDAIRSQPSHSRHFVNVPGPEHAVLGGMFFDKLRGYVPIGFFQLWHSSAQKAYPYSLGTAAHDDVMFAAQWPESRRRLIPTLLVWHLCSQKPANGENWDGNRNQPRLK